MQGLGEEAGHILPQWASVNRVVLDLFKQYEPAFNVKRIGTGLDLDPVVPLTWGDRALLKRGFGGILSHAVKHSVPGGLVVVKTTMSGDYVLLTVGENGGADADDAEELLDKPALISGGELGLAERIVRAHGGQIGVDLRRGRGSRCAVRLPAVAMENARLSEELEQSRQGGRDLLAALSYELRTPLHAIMGYADLLAEGTFGRMSRDQIDTVQRIDQGARELLHLVEGAIDARSGADDSEVGADASLRLPERLHSFCQLAIETLECDTCLSFVWQPGSDSFVPAAIAGMIGRADDWFPSARLSPAQVSRLLSRDNGPGPAVLMDPRELLAETVVRDLRLHATVLLPIRRGNDLLGLLVLGYARRSCLFTAEHAHFAEGVCDLAGLAVENSVLSEQLDHTQRLTAEFVSSMSHHSRIPLNVIIGYSDLLHEGEFGPLTDEQLGVTKRLRASGRELLAVINRNLTPDESVLRQYDA